MILYELTETENNPVDRKLEDEHGNRQYDLLQSLVTASLAADRKFLSQHVIKALNFHAITCLHVSPGEYRPCEVTVGAHQPPAHYRVAALMDDFVNQVNRTWDSTDPIVLATYVLWRLNYIHPFINGNGRTARAAAYFVLCVRAGGLLPGAPLLPELIRQERVAYVEALRVADASLRAGNLDLSELHNLIMRLVAQQIGGPTPPAPAVP